MHETRRIEDRKVDLALVELLGPFAPVRHAKILVPIVVRRDRAVPAVVRHEWKIEHRVAPRAVAGRHVFDDFLVGLADMAVGVDDAGRPAVRRLPIFAAPAVLHDVLLRCDFLSQLLAGCQRGGWLTVVHSCGYTCDRARSLRRRPLCTMFSSKMRVSSTAAACRRSPAM